MVDIDLGGIESEKSKMSRWQIGNGSLSVLEQVYSLDPFPGLDARRELAKQLNVSPRQVQVWFQNKRQRERKISRAKGQLSTPGLPDTPAAQAAQVERARAGPGLPDGLELGMTVGNAPGGLSGGALSLSGVPGSGATLGMPPLHGGSSGAGGEAVLGGQAPLQAPAPGEPPRDSIFGLPMTRSCSNPAGFGQLGCPGAGLMDFDDKMEKEALDRLGLSPVEPERRAGKRASYDALPMARSMSLDSSLLGGPALLGASPRNASFDALGVMREGGMSCPPLGEQRGGLGAPRLPWLSGIGRGMTALNSADHVDMCRQAVAAAAAAFGKPGGLSGQTRASPFDQPRGGGGLPRQHVPVAPSPFDSQLVQNSLRAEPELMRSFSATLGDGSTYVPPSGSTFQCVRGRSALRASESLDSEGVIPSLDELAAMEDLPDDLQQAIAAISDGGQGNHFEVKPAADASFDVSTTPACSDACRSKSQSPDRHNLAARGQVAGLHGLDAPIHGGGPGGLFAGAMLQGEPMKRSGVSFIMDDMSLMGGSSGLEGIIEGSLGGAEPSQIPNGGKGRMTTPADCGPNMDAPPLLSSSHSSQSSVGGTRPDSGRSDEPNPVASAAATTAEPQSQMSSTEASDMQAAADSYVQVILSGEAPYQIVWASEAWLKLVGYPNDEACGKTLQLVEGPLTSQASVDQLTRAIRGGNAVKVPMIYHARSGRAFSHEMRVEPLKDSLGLVQCFQVTSAEVQFLKADAPLPGQYSCEQPPPLSSSGLGAGLGAGKGDGRLEIDEMLEWLDSGTGLKEQSAECLS